MLLETRVKVGKHKKIVEKLFRSWDSVANYGVAVNGRVWICWNPRTVQVKLVEEHEQALHCEILDIRSGQVQHMIGVYALNTSEQRKDLW